MIVPNKFHDTLFCLSNITDDERKYPISLNNSFDRNTCISNEDKNYHMISLQNDLSGLPPKIIVEFIIQFCQKNTTIRIMKK